MSNKITINGHDIYIIKIRAKEYKGLVLRSDKLEFQFNGSLQPIGRDDGLPTYQFTEKSQIIPSLIKVNLNVVSDWITNDKNKKYHNKTLLKAPRTLVIERLWI
jgi:hypothetical protein